jgi:hypothetical protein
MWGGGHHILHDNNQKYSGRTTENHKKEPKKTVFWAKNRKQNLKNTKEEWKAINCHVLCLSFYAFSTSDVTEHAAFWGTWINCFISSVVHQRWVLQIKAFSCTVSASDKNSHTSFLFPYKSRSITVIRAVLYILPHAFNHYAVCRAIVYSLFQR